MVNVDGVEPTFTVDYVIYDDGWSEGYAATDSQYFLLGNGTVDGTGSVTLTGEVGYSFKTEQHWNVRNTTTNTVVLNDQRVFGGTNIYTGENVGDAAAKMFDGLTATVDGNFAAPINFLNVKLHPGEGSTTTLSSNSTTTNLDIQNYTIFGGVVSSYAVDNFAYGTYSVDELQQDYELRFTGVYDEGTIIGGKTVYQVIEGGSYATCFRMVSGGALATHPLNPAPGTAEPFMVRIPFEVWNVDDPANPYQVNLTYRDRVRDGSEDPFWAWNPTNRMYGVIVNSPYNATQVVNMDADAEDEFNSKATWVLVMYGTNYSLGDVVEVNYANPIQLGKDTWSFTAPSYGYDPTQAAADVKEVNVFPNPYYGVNPNEINKYQRFVTFNHLPPKATLRMFNLGGQLVKTINKEDLSQFAKWDLTNENGLPLASGIYIAYIDMPDLGKTKILKVAIIQETQILDRF
jgi:hypothetical protein